jgi:hypothetical protein
VDVPSRLVQRCQQSAGWGMGTLACLRGLRLPWRESVRVLGQPGVPGPALCIPVPWQPLAPLHSADKTKDCSMCRQQACLTQVLRHTPWPKVWQQARSSSPEHK